MAKIMIVDDHEEYRRMLNRMLTQEGYDVVEAANGKIATNLYDSNQIDLVITDIFMPEKEGIETVLDLQKINSNVKIIAISGGGTGKDLSFLNHVLDFGASKTFEKPFDREELLSAIKDLLTDQPE